MTQTIIIMTMHGGADGRTRAIDPVCGMTRRPADHAAPRRARRAGLPLLLGRLPDEVRRRSGELSRAEARPKPAAAAPGRSTPARCTREIRQVGPGACPICGMALEPETVTADAGPNPELADMTRRFWIGLALTAAGLRRWRWAATCPACTMLIAAQISNWIQLALATPVVLWAGWPFFVRGWASLKTPQPQHVHPDRHGRRAWPGSTAWSAVLAPGLFPPAFRDDDGAVPVYFEAAAVITVLVLLGQVLELRARERTSGAIRALLDLAPKTARRVRADGTDEEVAARPGRTSATACGCGRARRSRSTASWSRAASSIDESLVTGESMPVDQGGRRPR